MGVGGVSNCFQSQFNCADIERMQAVLRYGWRMKGHLVITKVAEFADVI